MRPITLHMSGLQSYRELQEIDFTRLCDSGVFGIFGPTGSGKSTILDAITLALYGKVERASGGTQAIMNHAENMLFVGFTFELTSASGSERYRVERQFKRGSELSVQTAVSRLLRLLPEETVVLADKAGEVTQQVQDILGLSMADFTRAVVLPQGKFAEFLTLTGKDRRQMLQRLFHLEQYGDQLSAKVSSKVKETDSEIKQIAAEQQGLGDASEQALEDAKSRFQDAERHAAQSRERLKRQEQQYEQEKQLHGWLTEKAGLEQEEQKLQSDEPSIRQQEVQLQLSDQAERMKPYLEQWESARTEGAEQEKLLAEAERVHGRALAEFEEANAAHEKGQAMLSENEGTLLIRLEQLNQALVLRQELDQLQEEMESVRSQETAVAHRLQQVKETQLKAEEMKAKAILKQTELKEELGKVEVSVEVRQNLQAACQDKRGADLLQMQAAELEEDIRAKEASLSECIRTVRELEVKRDELLKRLNGWMIAVLEETAELQHSEQILLSQQQIIPRLIERVKLSRQEEERHALAARLAAQLEDGEACPVCGSTHHPLAAVAGEDIGAAGGSEMLLRDLEEQLAGFRELHFAMKQQIQRGQVMARQAQEAMPDGVEQTSPASAEAAAAAGRHAGATIAEANGPQAKVTDGRITETGIAALTPLDGLTTAMAEHRLLNNAVRAVQQRLDRLEREIAQCVRELRQAEQLIRDANAQQHAVQTVLSGQYERLAVMARGLQEQREAWQHLYPGYDRITIEAELELLLMKERQAEELRSRIDKSIPYIDGLLAEIDELRRQAAELDKTALQLQTRLQGQAQLAADKERQLAQSILEEAKGLLVTV